MKLLQHFKELTVIPKNAKELKGLILQLAIQGKLTAIWRTENPDIESASELLNRIKKEKEQLVKEKKIKKGNVLTELSKDEIPYALNEKWVWCRVGDITDIIAGASFKSGDFNETGGVKCIKITNAGVRDFVETNDYLPKGFDKSYPNYLIKEGDLILALTRPYIKDGLKISTCPPSYNNSLLNQRVASIRSMSSSVFHPYIFSYIQSPMVLKLYKSKFDGKSQQPNMKMGDITNLIISLPPLEEQKEIVKVVETLFKEVEQLEQLTQERITLKEDFVASALNQLTTNNANQEWAFLQDHFKSFFNETTNIKKLRETVLQLAVQGKLTADWRSSHPELVEGQYHASQLLKRIQEEKAQLIKDKKIKKEKALPPITKEEIPYELPEGWVWCRFQQIFDIRDGTHDSPSYISGPNTYPLVTSKDFKNGEISFEKAKRISKEDYDKINLRSLVEGDDILFSMIGGNLGNQVMVKGNTEFAIKNVALFKYYKKSLSVPDYLKTFSEHIAYAVQEKASGGAQPFVSLTFLRQMLFPLPPLEEQKAIVQKVNALMGLCDTLEQEIQQSQQHSEQLMQSCLREVFEGEVAVAK